MKLLQIFGATIFNCDAITALSHLPDESVQCCVTSPPYYRLRDYETGKWEGGHPKCDHAAARNKTRFLRGGNLIKQGSNRGSDGSERIWKKECPTCGAQRVDFQIGQEETPEQYIENMVAVFREVKRILRPDGTLWINIGDSAAMSGMGGNPEKSKHQKQRTNKGSLVKGRRTPPGYKPKDWIGIPHMLAFALRADGWYWRDEIIWHKPNAMPSSTTDRCSKNHEFIFMFAKSKRYYYDQIAIREPAKTVSLTRNSFRRCSKDGSLKQKQHRLDRSETTISEFANKRSIWTVPVAMNKDEHFAAYPMRLITPCIRAGTSKKGCCPICKTPWIRIVESLRVATRPGKDSKVRRQSEKNAYRLANGMHSSKTTLASVVGNRDPQRHISNKKTVGWRQQCHCIDRVYTRDNDYNEETPSPVPCTIIDPFAGTGTTGAVAIANNCHAILIELNPKYISYIKKKLKKAQARKGFNL